MKTRSTSRQAPTTPQVAPVAAMLPRYISPYTSASTDTQQSPDHSAPRPITHVLPAPASTTRTHQTPPDQSLPQRRHRPPSRRSRSTIRRITRLIFLAPPPKYQPPPIIQSVYTHQDLLSRRRGGATTTRKAPENLPLCTAPGCPVRDVHFQGIYLHEGEGRMQGHEVWGDSNPGPEVWEAWGRVCMETEGEGDRECVRRFGEFHGA